MIVMKWFVDVVWEKVAKWKKWKSGKSEKNEKNRKIGILGKCFGTSQVGMVAYAFDTNFFTRSFVDKPLPNGRPIDFFGTVFSFVNHLIGEDFVGFVRFCRQKTMKTRSRARIQQDTDSEDESDREITTKRRRRTTHKKIEKTEPAKPTKKAVKAATTAKWKVVDLFFDLLKKKIPTLPKFIRRNLPIVRPSWTPFPSVQPHAIVMQKVMCWRSRIPLGTPKES